MPGAAGPDEHDDGLPDLPPLPGVDPDRRADLLAASVYPTLLFAVTGTLATWYEVVVHSHDRLTLRIRLLLEPEVAADAGVIDAAADDPRGPQLDPRRGHPRERGAVAGAARAARCTGTAVTVRGGDLAVQPVLGRTRRQ